MGGDRLVSMGKLPLTHAHLAEKRCDAALQSLALINAPSFKATADAAVSDVYVAKNDIENAKKADQSAWDQLVERKQERQILQIKLESVGILVDDPEIERPLIETAAEETE